MSMFTEVWADWNKSNSSTDALVCHNYYNVASTVVLSALSNRYSRRHMMSSLLS